MTKNKGIWRRKIKDTQPEERGASVCLPSEPTALVGRTRTQPSSIPALGTRKTCVLKEGSDARCRGNESQQSRSLMSTGLGFCWEHQKMFPWILYGWRATIHKTASGNLEWFCHSARELVVALCLDVPPRVSEPGFHESAVRVSLREGWLSGARSLVNFLRELMNCSEKFSNVNHWGGGGKIREIREGLETALVFSTRYVRLPEKPMRSSGLNWVLVPSGLVIWMNKKDGISSVNNSCGYCG